MVKISLVTLTASADRALMVPTNVTKLLSHVIVTIELRPCVALSIEPSVCVVCPVLRSVV